MRRRIPHHPVVEAFLSTDLDLLTILRNASKTGDPISRLMLRLRKSFSAQSAAIEAALAAARFPLGADTDPDLAIFFLALWAEVALAAGRPTEAEAIFKRAESLCSRHTPPELKARLVATRSFLRPEEFSRNEEGLHRSLAAISPASPRRFSFLNALAHTLAFEGRAIEMDADISAMGRRRPEWGSSCRLLDCIQRGCFEKAAAHLETVLRYPEWTSFNADIIEYCQGILPLMRAVANRQHLPAGEAASLPDWVRVLAELSSRRPAEALRRAHRSYRQDADSLLWPGLHSLNLVRAELSAGHASTARRLLEMRWERGRRHYFDALYLARIELADGRPARATAHFARAEAAARRYKAEGRLDFELRLACELSPADIFRLGRVLKRSNPAEDSPETFDSPDPLPAPTGTARLLGESRPMKAAREAIRRCAPAEAPVLLLGETGTGKELAARALHEECPRRGEPFLAVVCGAIAESLLESELFGHERGAFTGAERARRGFFEEAGKGTLFLDEIGEIPPRLQAALLRVLETGEIRPVGSSRTRKVSCRVVAATNRDLESATRKGRFREDLWYRIGRLVIRIPSLRERPEDIPLLARRFLEEKRPPGERLEISDALAEALKRRTWPGNVRELKNAIERMRILGSDKPSWDVQDLEPSESRSREIPQAGARTAGNEEANLLEGKSSLRRLERLRGLFRRHGLLTRQEAARLTGSSPKTTTRDLAVLRREGVIEKVRPTAAPRTHYFRFAGGK